jgi:hypothetical protein
MVRSSAKAPHGELDLFGELLTVSRVATPLFFFFVALHPFFSSRVGPKLLFHGSTSPFAPFPIAEQSCRCRDATLTGCCPKSPASPQATPVSSPSQPSTSMATSLSYSLNSPQGTTQRRSLPELGHHGVQHVAGHTDAAPVDGAMDEGQRRSEPQRR